MPPFSQSHRQAQIPILEILNVCLWLKLSPSLILNKIERFSKVSQFVLKRFVHGVCFPVNTYLKRYNSLFNKGLSTSLHQKNRQKIPGWSLLPFRRPFPEKPEASCLRGVKMVKTEAIFFRAHGGLQKRALRHRTAPS